jgi:vacuolar-type H+-ATPase subunit F/Vma7
VTNTGVVVVVPSELETGFRLAGVSTIPAETAKEATTALEGLMREDRGGVIAVYEPFLDEVPEEERLRFEASTFPVVVPLPPGLHTRDEESHRARISAMLSRAVGYHITFGEEGAG